MRRVILALVAAAALGGCVKMDKTPPKDMPAYVKLYPGSTQMMSMNMAGMQADVITTPDTQDAVLAFYRTQATADGLTETSTPPSSGAAPGDKQVTFTDAAADKLLVVIAKPQPSGPGTMISLTWKAAAKAGS